MEPFEIKGTLNPEDISDGDFYRFNMVTRQKFEDGEFSKTDYSYIGDYFNIGYEETRHRKLSRIFLSFDPWNEHGYEVTDVTLYTYLTFVPIHEPDHAYGLLVLTEHTDEDAPGGCVDMIIKYKMFDKNMTAYQTVQCMMEYIDQCAKELLTSKLYNIKMMEEFDDNTRFQIMTKLQKLEYSYFEEGYYKTAEQLVERIAREKNELEEGRKKNG